MYEFSFRRETPPKKLSLEINMNRQLQFGTYFKIKCFKKENAFFHIYHNGQ